MIISKQAEQAGTEIQEHSVLDTGMMNLLDSIKKMGILTRTMKGDDYNGKSKEGIVEEN